MAKLRDVLREMVGEIVDERMVDLLVAETNAAGKASAVDATAARAQHGKALRTAPKAKRTIARRTAYTLRTIKRPTTGMPDGSTTAQTWDALKRFKRPATVAELADKTGLTTKVVENCIHKLKTLGVLSIKVAA